MVYAHIRIRLENKTYKILQDFSIQTKGLIPARTTDLVLFLIKRELVALWILPFKQIEKIKIKEAKTYEEYLDLPRKLRKLDYMG